MNTVLKIWFIIQCIIHCKFLVIYIIFRIFNEILSNKKKPNKPLQCLEGKFINKYIL